MRKPAIRRFSAPLSEARRHPDIDNCALFVERLFGRPLKADPDLIVVSPGNRKEFLDCLREDFRQDFFFSPFHFLLPRGVQQMSESDLGHIHSMPDLLRPSYLYNRFMEAGQKAGKRAILGFIAGEDSMSRYMRLRRGDPWGVHMDDERLIVIRHDAGLPLLVHEVIHAEDHVSWGSCSNRFGLSIREGRAKFGENLYKEENRGRVGEPEILELKHWGTVARALLRAGPQTFMRIAKEKGLRYAVEDMMRFLKQAMDTNIAMQGLYLPFAVALNRLAHAVGDPYLAFRISTEKPPKTRRDVRRVLEYYKPEIDGRRDRASAG